MLAFYITLLIPIFLGLRFNLSNSYFNKDYISVEQTNNIKGIFIWLVFIGHILKYIVNVVPFDSFLDKSALTVHHLLSQLVVVPFMFYSGYGVMNSIKNKRDNYVESIPRKRVLATILNFGVAVSCFIILNLLLGISMDIEQIVFSYIGWFSVGNSNWYIFTICFCYISSYISYKICGYSRTYLIVNILIVSVFMLLLSRFKPSWWYDTCLAYCVGSVFSFFKEKIESFIFRKYTISLLAGIGLFVVTYIIYILIPFAKYIFMNVCSIAFSYLIIVITMKLQVKNRFLRWSGKNLFPLYIYQRIPMILFFTIYNGILVTEYKYTYVVLCAIMSVIFAYIYKFINIKLT